MHRIFIVEDDPYTRDLYKETFGQHGFEVVMASDADGEFVERVAEAKPDIISMDLMIAKEGVPDTRDGFQAMELLRADERTSDIPIIVLSNFFQEDRVERAKALGAVDYINAQGGTLFELPRHYSDYLDDPKHYRAVHPSFRKA